MQQNIDAKSGFEAQNLLENTLTRPVLSEIEMKLLYPIRGANTGGICLADSEAQGSAVRQSVLCYVCRAYSHSMRPKGMEIPIGNLALLN